MGNLCIVGGDRQSQHSKRRRGGASDHGSPFGSHAAGRTREPANDGHPPKHHGSPQTEPENLIGYPSTWNGRACSIWNVSRENIKLIEEDGKVEWENNLSSG
jgi:hypothetical protein